MLPGRPDSQIRAIAKDLGISRDGDAPRGSSRGRKPQKAMTIENSNLRGRVYETRDPTPGNGRFVRVDAKTWVWKGVG